MTHQLTRIAALASAIAFSSSIFAQDGHGHGPVEPGPVGIDGLNLGEHWFGPEIDKQDLQGKVVLVEIWGS